MLRSNLGLALIFCFAVVGSGKEAKEKKVDDSKNAEKVDDSKNAEKVALQKDAQLFVDNFMKQYADKYMKYGDDFMKQVADQYIKQNPAQYIPRVKNISDGNEWKNAAFKEYYPNFLPKVKDPSDKDAWREAYMKKFAYQYTDKFVPHKVWKNVSDGAEWKKAMLQKYAPCARKKTKDEIADCFVQEYAGKDIEQIVKQGQKMVKQERAAKTQAAEAQKKEAKEVKQDKSEDASKASGAAQVAQAPLAQPVSAKGPSPKQDAEKAPAREQAAAKAPAPEQGQQSAPSSADKDATPDKKATNLIVQTPGSSNSAVFAILACIMIAVALASFIIAHIQKKTDHEGSNYLLADNMA